MSVEMRDCSNDRIEHMIKLGPDILHQESEYEVTVLLQQSVAVGVFVPEAQIAELPC